MTVPRRSERIPIVRRPYTPSPFNSGASFTESALRSANSVTPAKQVVHQQSDHQQVTLSGRAVEEASPAPLAAPSTNRDGTRMFSRAEETVATPVRSTFQGNIMGSPVPFADQIFNAWYFADLTTQSDVFMAMGQQVFRHEHEDRAADRLISFLWACNETTRYNVFKKMYDDAKATEALPVEETSSKGTTPAGGTGGIDSNTAALVDAMMGDGRHGGKGGAPTDGPKPKRNKGGGHESDAEEDFGNSMKAKAASIPQIKMTVSKILHERTAPTQVESWFYGKNHSYRAVCVPYFGNDGTKPGFRHASIRDAVLKPAFAFMTRPDLKEAAEYFVVSDGATWARLVASAQRSDINTEHLGILPEEVDNLLFRAFCYFAALDLINSCEDACWTVGGLFNTLTAGGHHPSQFDSNAKIPPAESRTPYNVRNHQDRWASFDGFHLDTLGPHMPDTAAGGRLNVVNGWPIGGVSGGGGGGGNGNGGDKKQHHRRSIQGLSAAEVESIPLCFFGKLSNTAILAYHAAKVAGKCLNCYKDGHMGRECTDQCAWPMCMGKPAHVAKACTVKKSKD